MDRLNGGSGRDIFSLVDHSNLSPLGTLPHYRFGDDTYAVIEDFNRIEGDKVGLNLGSSVQLNDFSLDSTENLIGSSSLDTQILYHNTLIGIVQDVSDFSLITDTIDL